MMKKLMFMTILFLTVAGCKQKIVDYTDMENAMINQICESDQDCKKAIDNKFKEKEFLEGDMNNIRSQRAQYLEMKIKEKKKKEVDDFINKPDTRKLSF